MRCPHHFAEGSRCSRFGCITFSGRSFAMIDGEPPPSCRLCRPLMHASAARG